MRFSHRIGIESVATGLQTYGMTDALRNSLWNVLDDHIWNRQGFVFHPYNSPGIKPFSRRLWFHYFKKPMDSRPDYSPNILAEIRNYYFTCKWNEVYDFVEFILQTEGNKELNNAVNEILERELSGYRFIGTTFIPVTDELELEAVQEALSEGPFAGVHAHLKAAVNHLARRESPDYRNSIKESISAVESMARELTQDSKATLGDALLLLERHGGLHPALKKGFSALYGYTSDEAGIRHAMLEEPNLTVADAKFFLISCSTFINYLKASVDHQDGIATASSGHRTLTAGSE